jgi:hypothetical protein
MGRNEWEGCLEWDWLKILSRRSEARENNTHALPLVSLVRDNDNNLKTNNIMGIFNAFQIEILLV